MPKLQIWNRKEIASYDNPPYFNTYQRKLFFTLPRSLAKKQRSFHSLTNQIGFHLMFGYFKACRRFFTPARFQDQDIEFVCKRMGVFSFGIEMSQYSRATYLRHKRMILNYFGCQSFDANRHRSRILKAISRQVKAQVRPKLVLEYLLDWLEKSRIEFPAYHSLQTLVADAIMAHKKKLIARLNEHLTSAHKAALDRLLEQDGDPSNQPYLLTKLKKLIPSEKQKHIKTNLETLNLIWEIFDQVAPLIELIGLHPDAIRYYGELVLHFRMTQLTQKHKTDQYLYLLAFVAYQIYICEDWMVDTFLSGCKSAINQAQKAQKDYIYEKRKIHRAALRRIVNLTEDRIDMLESIEQIVWADEEMLSPAGKVAYLQSLLPPLINQSGKAQVKEFKEQFLLSDQQRFYQVLEQGSISLQKQVSGIVKGLHFNPQTSDKSLFKAIEYFRAKEGRLSAKAPAEFLSEEEKAMVFPPDSRFRISLYKALLFKSMCEHLKAGSLNLTHSYRFKAYDEYLIPKKQWLAQRSALLKEADLTHLVNSTEHLKELEKRLNQAYDTSNRNILMGDNPHIRLHKSGKFHVNTPASTVSQILEDQPLFPSQKIIPLSEILATIEKLTGYLGAFSHLQPTYQKSRPDKRVFFAGITAYGCNLGIPTMAEVAFPLTESELEQTTNWYFSLQNINKASDSIANFIQNLDLPNLYLEHQDKLHTVSDGQRIPLNDPYALHGSYSPKYFRKGKGISAYSFLDERYIPFYSTVIDPADREAIYVIDGLLHNEIFRSSSHATDTHGQTEAVFGLMDLLGFDLTPRIAKLYKQTFYSFTKRKDYQQLGYPILPGGYINTKIIEDNWDHILRLVTSLKLKVCTAALIFKRLNSYSRQHPVYQALKEYGKILKSIYMLRYIDDLPLRQLVNRQLNKIEHANRFSKAVAFANGGEMIFPTRQEQRIAQACKRLIKSAIICWNYLFLSKKVKNAQKEQQQKTLLDLIKAKSPMRWRHIYFHGFYDFSDEKLIDSFNLSHAQFLSLKIA
ncbi:MAG: Tn3 family transposase [Bacteroidota bacterium]